MLIFEPYWINCFRHSTKMYLCFIGAEKALFRALKTRSNTPKYGLLYHSTFIGRAGVKNKGRISRYLANKCSIASRIDCFSGKGPLEQYRYFFLCSVGEFSLFIILHNVSMEKLHYCAYMWWCQLKIMWSKCELDNSPM